ncbi:MAG: NADH-quinone oxidoreductase subunit NuoH [Nitrospiraceae bacterium]|jgi:NADH-quinone oxidoreductase subunit H|nr:NADH-quinone oxidoreductase subunit NuoH [Nitrospiraceae bacterium]
MELLLTIGKSVLFVAVVFAVTLLHVAYATYFERKVIGRMQGRIGPVEVGFRGLLQPFADMVKSLFKEDIIPNEADRPLFFLAPVIVVASVMTSLAVIPFFNNGSIANLNVGVLFIFAMASLAVYGIIVAGWSSNSKYAFLGGVRSAAQVISYEIAMGISLAGVFLMAGSLNLSDIVLAQREQPMGMFAVVQVVGFVVFVISAFAETNRTPFDLPEAETELVAGYLTEYSGFRYALFFLAEYISMYIMAALVALCYLGGWALPGFLTRALPFLELVPGIVWFLLKVYAFMFFYFWVRATLPRYRFDQLMAIGWKILIPVAVLNMVITAGVKRWLM